MALFILQNHVLEKFKQILNFFNLIKYHEQQLILAYKKEEKILPDLLFYTRVY